MSDIATNPFEQWAILELMGHVKLAGKVTEEERFGQKMGRIDIPDGNGGFTTQYFGGSSVYRLTPTSEEVAREVSRDNQPSPIHPWQVRRLTAGNPEPDARDADEIDDDDDDEFGDSELLDDHL